MGEAESNQAQMPAFGHLHKGVSYKVTTGDFHFLISQLLVILEEKGGEITEEKPELGRDQNCSSSTDTHSYGVEPQNVRDNKNLSVMV